MEAICCYAVEAFDIPQLSSRRGSASRTQYTASDRSCLRLLSSFVQPLSSLPLLTKLLWIVAGELLIINQFQSSIFRFEFHAMANPSGPISPT